MSISTESNTPAKGRDDKDQATVELQDHESYQILEGTRCHYQQLVRLAANSLQPKFREKVNIHTLIPTTLGIPLSILKTLLEIHEQKAKIQEESLINLEPSQLQLLTANLAVSSILLAIHLQFQAKIN